MPRDYDDDDDDRPRRRRPRDEDQDDDRPRARRRARDYDEDEDDRPRRRPARSQAREMSVLGMIGLVVGLLALVVSFMPCFASLALIPAGIGIILGFIAVVVAQKSDGRQGMGLPIAGLSVSGVAVLIAVGWLILGKQVEKKFEKIGKEAEARAEREEAQRKKDLARAGDEVKAAGAGTVLQVTPAQFYKAYDDDEDRADRLYKGKVIEMTGVVDRVDLEGDTFTVYLKAGPMEGDTVDCEFAKSPEVRAQLGRLKPGDTVRIRGKCLGGGSTLEACILVE